MMHGYIRCVATSCWDASQSIVAEVPLCDKHRSLLTDELTSTIHPPTPSSATVPGPGPVAPDPAAWSHGVYYIVQKDKSDLVKIGTSINVKSRVAAFKKPRLLVVEPGSYDVETRRHRQFSHFRHHGEWFRFNDAILEHIDQIRRTHPAWRALSQVGYRWD